MRKIFSSLFLITLFSCNKSDDKKVMENQKSNSLEVTTNDLYTQKFMDDTEIKNLVSKIKKEGDTIAFHKLKEVYYNSGHKSEFLYYSLYMSNVYNYKYAFYTNYSLLMSDIITKENQINNYYANYYLLKSYELGYKESLGTIKERFGAVNIPNSKEYFIKNIDIILGSVGSVSN